MNIYSYNKVYFVYLTFNGQKKYLNKKTDDLQCELMSDFKD